MSSVINDLSVVRDQSWKDQAACSGLNTELWFPQTYSEIKLAKEICADCPVKFQCLEYALEIESSQPHKKRHGLYGGLTGKERARLARESDRDEPLTDINSLLKGETNDYY